MLDSIVSAGAAHTADFTSYCLTVIVNTVIVSIVIVNTVIVNTVIVSIVVNTVIVLPFVLNVSNH